MSQQPTDKEVGEAALASLIKSTRPQSNKSDAGNSRSNQYQEATSGKQTSPASAKLMAQLWAWMTRFYGHKWTSTQGTSDLMLDENGKEQPGSGAWGKALAGMSPQQLGAGLDACRLRDDPWPPSAPEFRALCEAGVSNLGIPSVDAAWREAVEASSDPTIWKFSHPIVQEAARLTDWYSIRTGTPKAETVQNRFGKRYADLTAKLQRGEPLVEGQLLISQEAAQDEREKAERANEQAVLDRIKAQGLDKKTPEELRAEMRAKLGIRR